MNSEARERAVAPPNSRYDIVDLFAGSGAFTLGLRQAGLTGKALLVDKAKDCSLDMPFSEP